jgi:hypothetical protein
MKLILNPSLSSSIPHQSSLPASIPQSSPFGVFPAQTVLPSTSSWPSKLSKSNKQFNKTIIVVSLKQKPAGGFSHSVVTQIYISIDATVAISNITEVAKLVENQVGFPVVLLDSKLYPIMDNETTRSVGFWKSTRKILAACRLTYDKLSGGSADVSRASEEDFSTEGPPEKKFCEEVENKLNTISETLVSVDRNIKYLARLQLVFQCVICKNVASPAIVSPCCGRIIGCEYCVERWMTSNTCCPFCKSESGISERFKLKGLDEILELAEIFEKYSDDDGDL